ncbi:thiamine pyrophosphate-binding protein (plasmid) [Rhizobium sp. WYJ-E13]|nr:thiamine pyrophosphate-binding protein [Rhizobium sp. WYJ-E13]
MLRKIGIRYVALNPGSSFRGLHDSLVNRLGNEHPQMLLCLHEEHAVAIAHGFAKVTGEPLAVILHSNVGLMHGSMAIFNAWCDRVPMLVFGATGPVDAALRRPWIDWLHTSRDQGALVRHFVKWDDQPASVESGIEAILRANMISRTAPSGPTYVNFDVSVQEKKLDALPELPDVTRHRPPLPAAPSAQAVGEAAHALGAAKRVVVLAGRVSRSPKDWARRVALVEALGASVITDIKVGAAFPTDHRAHCAKPAHFLDDAAITTLAGADVILSLDWVDLAGTLKQAKQRKAIVIQVSQDHVLHNGWGMEHQSLPAVDIHLACEPDVAVHLLADALGVVSGEEPAELPALPAFNAVAEETELDVLALASALGEALSSECISMVRLPLGWAGEAWHFRHPLDYLGGDGGAGIGSGPGMLIGAALGLRGTGRLAVGVLGDGDFMMAASAFWTAAHYRIPFVAIVANNRSFFNDEVHQERVATMRERPIENKWIGQQIADPDIAIAEIARAQGVEGIGPVSTAGELSSAVRKAVEIAKEGRPVVIDARVKPGYSPNMVAGLTRAD